MTLQEQAAGLAAMFQSSMNRPIGPAPNCRNWIAVNDDFAQAIHNDPQLRSIVIALDAQPYGYWQEALVNGRWWARKRVGQHSYKYYYCEQTMPQNPERIPYEAVSPTFRPRSKMMRMRSLRGLEELGFGALTDDIAAALKISTDPLTIAKQFWGQIQGRTWDQAIVAASARASSKNWIAKSLEAKNDFITILFSSIIAAKASADGGNLETANDLNRTWVIIARRMGIDKTTPAQTDKMKTTAAAEVAPIVLIVGVIAAALAISAIYIALLYFASKVVDEVLAKIECDRELIRIHNDFNKVVEKHNAEPSLAWSDADKELRDKLLEQQRIVAAGCIKSKGDDFSPWPYVIGAGLIGATTLAIVYRKNIQNWLSR